MKYNDNNLIVASTMVQLENELDELLKDITDFKQQLRSKFNNFDIDCSEDTTLTEAINKLKLLQNASDIKYGNIFNGVAYDLEKEPIANNEIKFVALVKSGQKIGFDLGLIDYRKPKNPFDNVKQFITVDWGDGTSSLGYNKFVHIYDDVDNDDASLKSFNDHYKQVIVTVKPSSYDEEESTLMPYNIAFHSTCSMLILGIHVNYVGKNTEYFNYAVKDIAQYQNYYNLRYFYTTEGYLPQTYAFNGCTRLEKIKAKKLYINNTSAWTFQNNWSLKEIDADIIVDKIYDATDRKYMFANCYNLSKIKSLNLGTVVKSATYSLLFSNCFKLEQIPELQIDCSTVDAIDCQIFNECRSLVNPFQYVSNLNMLKNAYRLFAGCHKIVEAPEELDLSLATNASCLFENCINMITAPKKIYLDKATDIRYFFSNCCNLKHTPSIMTTPEAKIAIYMFYKCYNLEVISCDLNLINTQHNYYGIFEYCYSLRSFECNKVILGKNYVWDLVNLFSYCPNLKKLPLQEFACSVLHSRNFPCDIEEFPETITIYLNQPGGFAYEFRTTAEIKRMPKVINIKKGESTTGIIRLFQYCRGMKSINDLTINIDEDINPDITYLMDGCWGLETINNFTLNAPNAVSINNMFSNCYRLTTLNNVHINLKANADINISSMFENCFSLLEIPDLGFNYEDCVGAMASTFKGSGIKHVNWENPFTKLKNATYAFASCKRLEKMNIKISSNTDFNYWFNSCHSLHDFDCSFEMPNNNNPFNNSGFSNIITTNIKLDFKNKPWGNNATFGCSNCSRLATFEIHNYANTNPININDNSRLRKLIITFKEGVSCNINIKNGKIPVEALNSFFESLPTVTSGNRIIYVKGQEHIGKSNTNIATAKGWTINTTA